MGGQKYFIIDGTRIIDEVDNLNRAYYLAYMSSEVWEQPIDIYIMVNSYYEYFDTMEVVNYE